MITVLTFPSLPETEGKYEWVQIAAVTASQLMRDAFTDRDLHHIISRRNVADVVETLSGMVIGSESLNRKFLKGAFELYDIGDQSISMLLNSKGKEAIKDDKNATLDEDDFDFWLLTREA